jgi:hypothetical protein
VCANLAGLLEEEDAEIFVARLVGELLQANGGAETGRAWQKKSAGDVLRRKSVGTYRRQ